MNNQNDNVKLPLLTSTHAMANRDTYPLPEGQDLPKDKGIVTLPISSLAMQEVINLREHLLTANYSFGTEGQLNIFIPRYNNESNNEHKKRTKKFAEGICDHLENPNDVHSSKGRIVIHHPSINVPYMLSKLNIPMDWQTFAKPIYDKPSDMAIVQAHINYDTKQPPKDSITIIAPENKEVRKRLRVLSARINDEKDITSLQR